MQPNDAGSVSAVPSGSAGEPTPTPIFPIPAGRRSTMQLEKLCVSAGGGVRRWRRISTCVDRVSPDGGHAWIAK
jgi:hypothetical protein